MVRFVLAFLVLSSTHAEADQTFHHHLCQLSFDYPNDWRVEVLKQEPLFSGSSKHDCQISLTPSGFERSDSVYQLIEHKIVIEAGYNSFREISEGHGFRFEDGEVSAQKGKAESIRLNRLYGVVGEYQRDCATKIPGYEKRCKEARYVLSSAYGESTRTLVVIAPGPAEFPLNLLFRTLVVENVLPF